MKDIIARIRASIPIADYLYEKGYHLVRHGTKGKLRMVEHDSFIIDTERQRFWWNSRDAQGSIIDLVMLMEGVDAQKAISLLAQRLSPSHRSFSPSHMLPLIDAREKHVTVFAAPKEKTEYWPQVEHYLLKRGIEPAVIRWLKEKGIIYASSRGNLCCVSRNSKGCIDYATVKGTGEKRYIRVIEGGNFEARCAINLYDSRPTNLFVCEAIVDVFSIMSLLHLCGKDFTAFGYLSLDCCHAAPLRWHVSRMPQLTKIYLAQDNDAAGITSRLQCRALLSTFPGEMIDAFPEHKDWNEELKYRKGLSQGGTKIMLDEQSIHVELGVARFAGRSLIELMRMITHYLNEPKHGEQSMRQLNLQGQKLEQVDLDDDTVRDVKKQLKAHGVDFSIMRDSEKKLHLWFKAADIERIEHAMQATIANFDMPANKLEISKQNEETLMKEIMDMTREKDAEFVNLQDVNLPEKEEPQL